MSAENLTACADFTFQIEGDAVVSLDPGDAGNWSSGVKGQGILIGTKFGIAASTLISWLAPQAVDAATMEGLTQDTATAIFAARFWQSMSCSNLPSGVDLMVCDMGFNAGDATSVRILQQAVGFSGKDVDGWCGEETIAAVKNFSHSAVFPHLSEMAAKCVQLHVGVAPDGDIGPVSRSAILARVDQSFVLCAVLADAQLSYYRSLEGWARYGGGWSNRVVIRLTAAMKLAA